MAREPVEFQQITTRIATKGDLPIHIGAEEGRLLQMLIRLGAYKRIVEIGTHAAYSTMFIAQALAADGHLFTLEKDVKRIGMARETLEVMKPHYNCKVTLLEGDALKSLSTISSGVDMVFIDADKLNYCKYLDWAEANVRRGGLIIGDNTFLHGAVYGEPAAGARISPSALQAMQTFNLRLGDQTKYCSTMLPTAEGWTMGIKL